MDGLDGEVTSTTGATSVASEPAPENPVPQPVESVIGTAPGIPIERVAEVIERDPTPLGEQPAVPTGRRKYERQNKLENSPHFDEVKSQYKAGVNSARISNMLFEQKAFPELTYHGIRSMVDRALMRAGLMRPSKALSGYSGFTRPKKAAKPSRAFFKSSGSGEKLLSTHQLTKRYKVSESAIRSWVKRGALNLKEVGATAQDGRGHWGFPLAGLERWERKPSTLKDVNAVREFVTRQRAAAGEKVETYLDSDQVGARYGITGSGVKNWLKRGVMKKSEILAAGGFEGSGRALFTPLSFLLRWEKTPRAQELASVQDTQPAPRRGERVTVAPSRDKVLNLNEVGERYDVTDGAIHFWMQKGFLNGARAYFSSESRVWRIPLSFIEKWEQTPEARRVALSIPTFHRYMARKRPVTAAPAPVVSRPATTASKEVDVSAISRKTGIPTQQIRKVLETVGIQSKALKLPQITISEIERVLTAGSNALVKKGGGRTGFDVEAVG